MVFIAAKCAQSELVAEKGNSKQETVSAWTENTSWEADSGPQKYQERNWGEEHLVRGHDRWYPRDTDSSASCSLHSFYWEEQVQEGAEPLRVYSWWGVAFAAQTGEAWRWMIKESLF